MSPATPRIRRILAVVGLCTAFGAYDAVATSSSAAEGPRAAALVLQQSADNLVIPPADHLKPIVRGPVTGTVKPVAKLVAHQSGTHRAVTHKAGTHKAVATPRTQTATSDSTGSDRPSSNQPQHSNQARHQVQPKHTVQKTHVAKKPVTKKQKPAPPSGSSASGYAYAVLSKLNSERSAHGLRALTMNSDLVSSAHSHDLAMARANEMSHQCPGESYFADRIENAGYHWLDAGENIGWNSDTSQSGALFLETTMYNEGPGGDHYENIVNKHYTNVGIDVYIDNTHHKIWLTEDFGDR